MRRAFILFILINSINLNAKEEVAIKAPLKTPHISIQRQKIGPVYTSPAIYENQLYFLSSSGVLYTSDMDLNNIAEIFKTKLRSVSEVSIDGSMAYFGDGLHESQDSFLYGFDLKLKKLKFQISLKGHLEKKIIVTDKNLIVGLGPGGLGAFDKKTGKNIWKLSSHKNHNLHIDSTPVLKDNFVYVGSIYDYKAILCVEKETGKVLWSQELSKSPKSDLIYVNSSLIALATDGDLTTTKRDFPSDLVIIDPKDGKIKSSTPLRGSNYFPQIVNKNNLFVSLSTGDIIEINLNSGKISVIDQYPEPFLSSTFQFRNHLCAASLMGRIFCYENNKLAEKKELGEMIIGKISETRGRVYLPTRAGYVLLK